MTLFRYDTHHNDPFSGLDALLDHFNRGFRNSFSNATYGRQVPVNLYETEASYEVRAELPGFKKEDVSLEIENAVLTIRAARKEQSESGDNEVSFSRDITVGDDIDADGVKAKLEDGVLAIRLPKTEAKRPKAIKIS